MLAGCRSISGARTSRHRVGDGFVRDVEHRLGSVGRRRKREPRTIAVKHRQTFPNPRQAGVVGVVMGEKTAAIRDDKMVAMLDAALIGAPAAATASADPAAATAAVPAN